MPTLHPTAVAQNLRLPVMTDNPWPSGNQNKKWWPYWSLDWAQTNCRQVLMMLNWCSKFGEDISFGSWGIVWKPNIHTHTDDRHLYTNTITIFLWPNWSITLGLQQLDTDHKKWLHFNQLQLYKIYNTDHSWTYKMLE